MANGTNINIEQLCKDVTNTSNTHSTLIPTIANASTFIPTSVPLPDISTSNSNLPSMAANILTTSSPDIKIENDEADPAKICTFCGHKSESRELGSLHLVAHHAGNLHQLNY